MAAISAYVCDVCGVQRGPSNHWLVCDRDPLSFIISPWNEYVAGSATTKHICGTGCALKLLSSTIDSWDNRKPATIESEA